MTTQFIQPVDELFTLRDWLRFAVSRFEAAHLVYGHGTSNAFDEAAFLLLAGLNLPIDTLEPWLDCRLTRAERVKADALISARIDQRVPAPYLLHSAWIGGYRFYIDERVIIPRSFIGELLVKDALASVVPDPAAIGTALDLCTGSGCLAIIAALAFPAARITASDISKDALTVAHRNVGDYELAERIDLIRSDLFADIPDQRFDLIISNPPYVTASAVAAFPPEYRAEPKLAHDGGVDGLDIVHRLLDRAADFLSPNGVLVVEVGDGREVLEAARPGIPFLWLDTETSEGEVFSLTAEDLTALRNAKQNRRPDKQSKRRP